MNRYVGLGISLDAGWGRQEGGTLSPRADDHNNTLGLLYLWLLMVHAKVIPPAMQTVGTPLQRLTRGACTVIVKHGGATVEVASRALVQNVTFTIRTGRQDRDLCRQVAVRKPTRVSCLSHAPDRQVQLLQRSCRRQWAKKQKKKEKKKQSSIHFYYDFHTKSHNACSALATVQVLLINSCLQKKRGCGLAQQAPYELPVYADHPHKKKTLSYRLGLLSAHDRERLRAG